MPSVLDLETPICLYKANNSNHFAIPDESRMRVVDKIGQRVGLG